MLYIFKLISPYETMIIIAKDPNDAFRLLEDYDDGYNRNQEDYIIAASKPASNTGVFTTCSE